MSFRILSTLATITALSYAKPVTIGVAHAPLVAHEPHAHATLLAKTEDYDPHPQYSYAYDIKDSLTGDVKDQHETRDGDVVHGSYSVIEPDGIKRTVEYTADPLHGFNAVVHKELPNHGAPVALIHAPVAIPNRPVFIGRNFVTSAHAPYTGGAVPVVYSEPLHGSSATVLHH